MNLDEFVARCNSDIVGKLVNIASRCAAFITKNFGGQLAGSLAEPQLFHDFASSAQPIAADYEGLEYAGAVRRIMALADRANQYIDQRKPWVLAKDPAHAAQVQDICTQGLNLFRILMIYLTPVLPKMAEKANRFFGEAPWTWEAASLPLLGRTIAPYEPLATRLDPKAVAKLIDSEARATAAAKPAADPPKKNPAPATTSPVASRPVASSPIGASEMISIEEFSKVELRVAKILQADYIDGADKLLQLRVDLGELGERQVFAGIRSAYEPSSLIGRLTVVVANLAPRKMRFGISQGMILAAGPGGKDLFLLSPDDGALPGMRVK